MDSSSITDAKGKHLRARYFPFHLKRKPPPLTAAHLADSRPELLLSSRERASTVPHTVVRKFPTTHMILDYRQDKKHLIDVAAREVEKESAVAVIPIRAPPPTALSPLSRTGGTQTSSPKHAMRKLRFEAQPLRSSFLLKKKLDGILDITDFLFNKADAACQTEQDLVRVEFPTLSEYQQWNNTVAEPFFKVSYGATEIATKQAL